MQHSSLCWSQPALCGMHALPALCTNWSFSSPAGLFHVAHRLCATCMWCLFGPPDWSLYHPVASPTCLQVQALLALCHLHVVPVWPSRLVSLSSSSPLLLAYRCRPYLLCAAYMWCLFGPPDWSVCHPVALFYSPTGAGPTCSVPPACGVCLSLQTGQSVIQ